MGLPSPNTARIITPRKSSWYLLPRAVQNRLRIRGLKAARLSAVVISLFLCILLYVKTPAPASKWIGWGRLPPSPTHNTTSTVAEPSHVEIFQSDENGLIDPPDADGYNDQEDLHNEQDREEPEGEEDKKEEDDPEWLRGYPNPHPQRSPSHVRFMTLATMVKNKRRWLREWIEFHLMMGFDHIIIYDNESEDEPYEILTAYVDQGLLTYIPWPPPSIPPMPTTFATRTERFQYQWLHDALETCYSNTWAMHKQGPCQLAAFMDAIFRTKGGISRWLAIWDVDEYIFPRERANMRTLSGIIRRHYADTDHLRFLGSVFGTSGHIVTPERQPGSPLAPLLTEEYTMRSQLDLDGIDPFERLEVEAVEVHGVGILDSFEFGNGDAIGRKSMVDPDMASHSWVHDFRAPDNGWDWKEEWVDVDDERIKFNHYAFLSAGDARRKSSMNKNPYMNYSEELDEFFSRERDTEVWYLLPRLKERMLNSLRDFPPSRPDDWRPSSWRLRA